MSDTGLLYHPYQLHVKHYRMEERYGHRPFRSNAWYKGRYLDDTPGSYVIDRPSVPPSNTYYVPSRLFTYAAKAVPRRK